MTLLTQDEVLDLDDEVGCWVSDSGDEHHGIACEHPSCTDCGEILEFADDTCSECGRTEAG